MRGNRHSMCSSLFLERWFPTYSMPVPPSKVPRSLRTPNVIHWTVNGWQHFFSCTYKIWTPVDLNGGSSTPWLLCRTPKGYVDPCLGTTVLERSSHRKKGEGAQRVLMSSRAKERIIAQPRPRVIENTVPFLEYPSLQPHVSTRTNCTSTDLILASQDSMLICN